MLETKGVVCSSLNIFGTTTIQGKKQTKKKKKLNTPERKGGMFYLMAVVRFRREGAHAWAFRPRRCTVETSLFCHNDFLSLFIYYFNQSVKYSWCTLLHVN